MKPKKIVYMPVDPEFRKKLKVESSASGISVLEYTRKLAKEDWNTDFEIKKPRFKLDF